MARQLGVSVGDGVLGGAGWRRRGLSKDLPVDSRQSKNVPHPLTVRHVLGAVAVPFQPPREAAPAHPCSGGRRSLGDA
jgi:hypothetical protein